MHEQSEADWRSIPQLPCHTLRVSLCQHVQLSGRVSVYAHQADLTELILPLLDQSPIYQKIDLSASVDVGSNRKLFEQRIFPFYACPSNPFAETFRTRDGSYFSELRTNDNPDGAGAVQGLAYPLCAGSIFPDNVPPDCVAGTNSYCVSEDPRSTVPSWWAPQSSKSPGMFNRGSDKHRPRISEGWNQQYIFGW